MSETRQTFRKEERLCRTKLISLIFESGKSIYTPLFRIVWSIPEEKPESPAQIAISVPKKNIRLAVSRNLIKRRIREAYRKNKHILYDSLEKNSLSIVFMVIYRKSVIADYSTIEKSVAEFIPILCRELDQTTK